MEIASLTVCLSSEIPPLALLSLLLTGKCEAPLGKNSQFPFAGLVKFDCIISD